MKATAATSACLTHFLDFVEEGAPNSEVESSSLFALVAFWCFRAGRKLCTGVLTNSKAFIVPHRPPCSKTLVCNHGNGQGNPHYKTSYKMARLSVLHYVTPKYVVLSDKRLGLIYYLLVILILIFTVFELFLWKGYLDVSLTSLLGCLFGQWSCGFRPV